MARILRARTAGRQPTVPKAASSQKLAGSWHDPSQLTRRSSGARAAVKRLFVRDPNNALFSSVADQFTNNPNPRFDPSKAPGNVQKVSVMDARNAANRPGKASRGHMKAISPNRFTLFGGKALKRR